VKKKRILKSLLKLIVLHLMVLCAFAPAGYVLLDSTPLAFAVPDWTGRFMLPAMSPHIMIIGAVSVRAVGLATLIGLPMLVIVTLRRRWFCRCLCPVGLIVDSCAKARPGAKYAYRKIPPLGQWFMLATLGGAIVGWPLFLWLDPLSIFTASLNAPAWPMEAAALTSLGVMLSIVVMSLLLPKFWCFKLCPLGGAQDMLFGLKLLATRKKDDAPASLSPVAIARRSAIFAGLGVAGGLVVARYDKGRKQPQLRPPGAVDDTKFKSLCARCGNCVKACPSGIISQELNLSDPAGLLTPVVHFEKLAEEAEDYDRYCRTDCNACTQACPTGAIEALSKADKLLRPIGLAKVDTDGCLLKNGGMCDVCRFDCPRGAINTSDIDMFSSEVIIDPAKCNGCGACVPVCPVGVLEVIPNGRYSIAAIEEPGK